MRAEEFKGLITLAIGKNRNQADFAKAAGISPEHLNRMLRHPEKYPPSSATLRKIADASNGRVALNRLEKACDMPISTEKKDDLEAVGEYYDAIEIVKEFKQGVEEFRGKATRYDDIDDVMETIEILYGRTHFTYTVENEQEYTGRGRAGAEYTANVVIEFTTEKCKCTFGFVMFFCKTTKNGIIFSDAAFDLPTMNKFFHRAGGKKLSEIAALPDANMSDYPTVYVIEPLKKT